MGYAKMLRQVAIVVEDDPIQRDMIALLLEESHFDVIQCEDAETAALAVKMRHPALVITDIGLTGKMNGIELAQYALDCDRKVRVMVISGQRPSGALPDGVKFFEKPIYPVTLLREAVQ
ncbi:response regulator [Bradyrhizobium sp. CCBAU 51753]|uniref:response regulator n=1 Tax=Bradyrhizobium sp. CCBAU 51753 TaxID=1325100 RepID=UPI00188D3A55|nr:response regulator [Bradyrhizobium sp. CCBAU 51753]QOZ29239.1 response regulator [Bradyrhizobium sp. CCBAU 51753]